MTHLPVSHRLNGFGYSAPGYRDKRHALRMCLVYLLRSVNSSKKTPLVRFQFWVCEGSGRFNASWQSPLCSRSVVYPISLLVPCLPVS